MCGVKKYNCKWLFSISGIYTHGHLFEHCFSWLFSRIYVTSQFKGNDITKFPDNCHWGHNFFGNKLLSKEKVILSLFYFHFFLAYKSYKIFFPLTTVYFVLMAPSHFYYLGLFPLCCRGIRE